MSEKKLERCEVCGKEDVLVDVEIHATKIYKSRLCTSCVNTVMNDAAEARKLALHMFNKEMAKYFSKIGETIDVK